MSLHAGISSLGFTLVEQVMTLVVAGVLATLAWPTLHALLWRHRVDTARMDFVDALQYARITAVREGTQMILCPGGNDNRCDESLDWSAGYLVEREDLGSAGIRLVRPQQSNDVNIFNQGSGRRRIRFQPDGSAMGSTVTVLFCQTGQASGASVVVLSNAGRVRSAPASKQEALQCEQSAKPRSTAKSP